MSWIDQVKKWNTFEQLDPALQTTLESISGNTQLLEESFYKDLDFGTGGIRAEMGPGTNRLNIYTIRRTAEGLARYVAQQGDEVKRRGVAIAYDSRHLSYEFSLEVAKTITKHGVKVYLFDELYPTPLLSYAVRYLKAYAGVVITASHNPSEYNGFKVYGEDGGQLPPEAADIIVDYISKVENELTVEVADQKEIEANGLLTYIGQDVLKTYIERLGALQFNRTNVNDVATQPKIVYTPLHGAGNKSVLAALDSFGFRSVTVVTEQQQPDGAFPTVKSPNPEEQSAFELAMQYGDRIGADMLLATDPDADRLGIAVKNNEGEYIVLSGNQIGALLLEYLLSQKHKLGTLPGNGIVIKTIVTSELGRAIAESYGLKSIDTLTGFKFIGEKMNEYEANGEYTFQFGYEESNGYLMGDFVHEKDAVQAVVVAAEMAALCKAEGKTVYQGLLDIYEKYGFYQEQQQSITLKGKDGAEQISKLMTAFREEEIDEIAGLDIDAIEDYQVSIRLENKMQVAIGLPKSNVLKYHLADGSWFCIRPSGTEPKVKFYLAVKGNSITDGQLKLSTLQDAVMEKVNRILAGA